MTQKTTVGKHTPGPWKHEDINFFPGVLYISSPEHSQIAGVLDNGQLIPIAEVFANARLIAAAPELLKALVKIIYGFGHQGEGYIAWEFTITNEHLAHCRALIAAARGEVAS
jgi:hypothetical protein